MGDHDHAARIAEHAHTIQNLLRLDVTELVDAAEAAPSDEWVAPLAGAIDSVAMVKLVCDQLQGQLTDALVKCTGNRPIDGQVIPGLGKLDLHQGDARKRWDGLGIGKELTQQLAHDWYGFDRETGEAIEPDETAVAIIARVVEVVIDAAGLDAASRDWRAKSLKSYGVNPYEYMTKEPGLWRAKITRGVIGPEPETT